MNKKDPFFFLGEQGLSTESFRLSAQALVVLGFAVYRSTREGITEARLGIQAAAGSMKAQRSLQRCSALCRGPYRGEPEAFNVLSTLCSIHRNLDRKSLGKPKLERSLPKA